MGSSQSRVSPAPAPAPLERPRSPPVLVMPAFGFGPMPSPPPTFSPTPDAAKEAARAAKGPSPSQVALLGSGGTWREEVAIPLLTIPGNGVAPITYYNPKVPAEEWTPEHQVADSWQKKTARILLFVIDGHVDAASSMLEAAYYMARPNADQKVVLVVERYEGQSPEEMEARLLLKSLSKKTGTPCFGDVESGVRKCIVLHLAEDPWLQPA